jgi:predicted histone-like DNA-binding protein
MQYRLLQKRNPTKPDETQMFYMNPVYGSTMNLKEVAKKIAVRSSLTYGNTLNVLENMVLVVPELMMEGHIVSLGSFGRFRLIPSSEGIVDSKDFSVQDVRRLRVSFKPDKEVRKALADIKYEPMRVYKEQGDNP